MADLFKKTAIDTEAAEDGKWFIFDHDDDTAFRLAMIPNRKYEQFIEREQRSQLRKYRGGEIPLVCREAVLKAALVECIILEWRNVEWKGKKLPFKKENAQMILDDKQAGRSIMEWIFSMAASKEEFRLEDLAEDVKN